MTAPRLSGTPVLHSSRLSLRAPVASDWPAWRDFSATDRARFVGGPVDPEKSWRAFGHFIGHWVLRGFGSFVVTLRDDAAPIGAVGPWCPEGWPECEIGWTMWDPAAEGRGYAFEAATTARAHAFVDLGWATAVSYIDPDNARSIALAERLGAVRDDAAERQDPRDLVYRHPAPAGGTA